MRTVLAALLKVQYVERQLAHVRRRLKFRQNAVAVRQQQIEQLRRDWQALHEKSLLRRADADRLALDLREKEERVAKLRSSLNTAKTNKEYASILTRINTLKADNAKLEEIALKVLQDVDTVKAEADQVQADIQTEEQRLAEVQKTNAEEVAKLTGMLEDLSAKRTETEQGVPSEALAIFDRIAANYDGEGMAVVEIHGRKTPHTYVCGGCFMGLNPEHANALQVRDEIRTCDNCGRILYLGPLDEGSQE